MSNTGVDKHPPLLPGASRQSCIAKDIAANDEADSSCVAAPGSIRGRTPVPNAKLLLDEGKEKSGVKRSRTSPEPTTTSPRNAPNIDALSLRLPTSNITRPIKMQKICNTNLPTPNLQPDKVCCPHSSLRAEFATWRKEWRKVCYTF